ncbi:putative ATPase [Coemansia sp. RSA 1933]|nr:putative ATPase [Coemansia sp. RSA 1933]
MATKRPASPTPLASKKGGLRELREKAVAQYEESSVNEAAMRMQSLDLMLQKSTVYASFMSKRIETKCKEKREERLEEKLEEMPAEPLLKRAKTSTKSKKAVDDDNAKEPRLIDGQCVSFRQPKDITGGVMRDYQLEGMEWLASLYENGLNGILADEMGLGKTLQTIAFLCYLREQGVWGPFLVVVPLSTLSNWVSEFYRFSPNTPVMMYHGLPKERAALRDKHLRKLDERFPVVITTYEISMKDRPALQRFAWKFIVIDEGHRIKNMNCKLVRELKAYQSANRLLLTGTPLQNSLAELWSLLNFLLPKIFNDLDSFQAWFDLDSIGHAAPADSADNAAVSHEASSRIVSKLHQILQPFLLRRLKVDVEKFLPPKREYLIACPMTPLQFEYYQAVRGSDLRGFLESKMAAASASKSASSSIPGTPGTDTTAVDDPEYFDPASITKDIGAKNSSRVRRMNLNFRLMQQRKVCQHPYLFDFPVKYPEVPDSEYLIDEQIVRSSGKLLLLDRLLPVLFSKGHRVLIFSQFASVLTILECYAEMRKWEYCRIDGAVGQTDRQEAIVRFNTNPDIPLFFLTTRSGGLGINLTSADTVILFDSDWNPQQDLQAQDRVHRIGQKRPVIVYRLAIAGSCENAMIKRARAKRKLEKLVIHEKRFKGLGRSSATDEVSVQDVAHILESDDSELFEKDQRGIKDILDSLGPDDRLPDDAILDDDEIRLLTDRSPEAYKAAAKSSARFEELEHIADEQNDVLATAANSKD